jgi:transposase
LRTRALAEAEGNADKVGAQALAQLLRGDYLRAVGRRDEQTQRRRGPVTHRTALMAQRARAKDHAQGLLGRLLLQPPCDCLWAGAGLAWLGEAELPAHGRLALDSELRQLGPSRARRGGPTGGWQGPRARLLMTLAGVNCGAALGTPAALRDVSRSRDGDHAAAYLGLAPPTRQPGRRCYQGPVARAGRGRARWLLTQSA